MIPLQDQSPGSRIPSATLWRLGLAGAAGLWLGRRIPFGVVAAAAGAWLLTRQKGLWAPQRPAPPPDFVPDDAEWPKAPVAEPFVPNTRAWDELRQAISPVVHSPPAEPAGKSATPDPALFAVESFAFEATEPFIIEDEDTDAPKG